MPQWQLPSGGVVGVLDGGHLVEKVENSGRSVEQKSELANSDV